MKETERLDKLLAHMGLGSRKDIRNIVKQGLVSVNRSVVKDSGLQVHTKKDEILVNGERIIFREFIYLMLNKPPGVISATEDAHEKTVIDLLADSYRHFDLFPVGRLDKDTEGLLLLTNDGKLAHNLLSPRKHVHKTYYVEVSGELDEQITSSFRQGVSLNDGYLTMPADLIILESGAISKAKIIIMEGKFHQVKRMFQAVQREVTYLQRISMGPLELDFDLPLGHYRELTQEEECSLRDT